MQVVLGAEAAVYAQRPISLVLFCALGLVMFIFQLAAGIWLWHYAGQYKLTLRGFDDLIAELRSAQTPALPDIAPKTQGGRPAKRRAEERSRPWYILQ